jgi:membrane-associated phospholipid phosphatase
VNDPLVVKSHEPAMRDPSRWQPLALDQIVAQNGLPIPGKVQRFVGPHWGKVRGFALPAPREGMPLDPGPAPRYGEPAFARAAVEVIRRSSELDPRDGVVVDISPRARGENTLGTNDGSGHARNPATGRPYQANRVLRADFARALTEFWADGPKSETPPGHWNTVANEVGDSLAEDGRIADRLEWDVKLYFALNGAVHDAAVAAWGAKGHYDTARPISMIRYLGAKRELPLVPGLVERAGGDRKIVVRSWRGNAADPATQGGGVGWIPAVDWIPYQQPTFVTPAFAGYISGHSTFSRAAAEVLTAYTGTPFFPGGMLEWKVRKGELKNELGPTRDVKLQWATYFDAADDAGISRLYGGIHIPADDFAGRKLGALCGKEAWVLAQRYFEGEA